MKISIVSLTLVMMATTVVSASTAESTNAPPSAFIGRFLKKGTTKETTAEDKATTTTTTTKPTIVPGRNLPPKVLDNKGLNDVFEKNKSWKKAMMKSDRNYFNKLGSTHTPEYMWIGCSDARVPANLIMGEDAGNVFVHRNVANMVINNDVNLMSALQYGVSYLKVSDIIVCGHYECGGVRAAEASNDHAAPLETWLRNIRDVYRLHKTELDAITDANQRHRRLVELNVIEQCLNVFKCAYVQKRRKDTYLEEGSNGSMLPRVHAMVFDPKSGDLKRIPVSIFLHTCLAVFGLYFLGKTILHVVSFGG